MGHRLVIWEGERPADFAAGVRTMREVSRRYLYDDPAEPSPAIRKFVEALTEIWPDDPADPRWERSPWKFPPILDSASGPSIYLDLTLEGGWRESNTIAWVGDDYGLTTFDFMLGMLLPAPEAAITRRKVEMARELDEAIERLRTARRQPRPATEGAWRPSTRRRRSC